MAEATRPIAITFISDANGNTSVYRDAPRAFAVMMCIAANVPRGANRMLLACSPFAARCVRGQIKTDHIMG
jgi:hypothetical protein